MGEKVLLHTCCAVCCSSPVKRLIQMEYEPVLYYYNPNIYPIEEYERRLNELIRYCDKMGYELIIPENKPDIWKKAVEGLENEPERGARCVKCFELRLFETARKAKELNINNIATTLLVSPHKRTQDIMETGKRAAEKYNIKFLEIDFKKKNGFLETIQIAKQENFYRQTYCGCIYSLR